MIINQQKLQEIYKSFSVIYAEAFQRVTPLWPQIATEVPSSSKEQTYKWLGKVPTLREWLGPRIVQNLTAYDYTIKNKSWELTVGVDRDDIEDDTLGVYRPLVTEMGESARLHPDELIFDLLKNGNTNLCYDSKAFFATDHPVGDGTKSNSLSGASSALSTTTSGFKDAMAAIKTMKDDQGKILNVGNEFLLVVPPALEEAARKVVNAQLIGGGDTNVWQNAAEILIVPDLAGQDAVWYLLATGKAIKPLIFQARRAPEFVSKDKPDDEHVFMNKEFLYGIDARYNAGYGLWQLAIRNAGS